jgi:hypothetical protein
MDGARICSVVVDMALTCWVSAYGESRDQSVQFLMTKTADAHKLMRRNAKGGADTPRMAWGLHRTQGNERIQCRLHDQNPGNGKASCHLTPCVAGSRTPGKLSLEIAT